MALDGRGAPEFPPVADGELLERAPGVGVAAVVENAPGAIGDGLPGDEPGVAQGEGVLLDAPEGFGRLREAQRLEAVGGAAAGQRRVAGGERGPRGRWRRRPGAALRHGGVAGALLARPVAPPLIGGPALYGGGELSLPGVLEALPLAEDGLARGGREL